MQAINKDPIDVDFNNCDKDGAVRLHLPRTVKSLEKLDLQLSTGQLISMSDGEIEILGTVVLRDGMWVATPVI